jgi:hydrogenase maturation protein HypF
MCLGIPGRVVEIVPGYADQLALVDVVGAQRRINVGMLDVPPGPGDWLLIHMGFALEIIDADRAEHAMAALELMGQARSSAEPAGSTEPVVAAEPVVTAETAASS